MAVTGLSGLRSRMTHCAATKRTAHVHTIGDLTAPALLRFLLVVLDASNHLSRRGIAEHIQDSE